MRVARSFAFVDVSGFTSLTQRAGDERAVEVLAVFRTCVRDICSRRGVRIAKWLGDGAMLVCVDTAPLVAAVLELQYRMSGRGPAGSAVDVRTGVTSGDVILLEGDDYIGHAVNVAARLCDRAAAGQVLADPSVLGALPRWGTVDRTESMMLRGIEEPLMVAHLQFRDGGPGSHPDPVCGLPLTAATAGSDAVDALGGRILFCSESCRDTWANRPTPPDEELGSPRRPLIGS